jgi:hypothetical protein
MEKIFPHFSLPDKEFERDFSLACFLNYIAKRIRRRKYQLIIATFLGVGIQI